MFQHKTMQWIETDEQLKKYCQQISKANVLGIDTEFIRAHTFWPKPCILQISDGTLTGIIDLQKSLDWAPLHQILLDEKIFKVFHSPRQDLEIFYHLWDIIPKPLFDTQLAATFLGMGEYKGYEPLIMEILNISLDKTMQFSKWDQRPLSDKQLSYAVLDVIYLPKLYHHLKLALGERLMWLQEEMADISNKNIYKVDPMYAWKKFKLSPFITQEQFNHVQLITTWRETIAQGNNIARSKILKDGTLWELCISKPTTMEELYKILFITEVPKKYYDLILEFFQKPFPAEKEFTKKPALVSLKKLHQLKKLVQGKADVYKLPSSLLASTRDLGNFLRGDDSRILHGWRYQLFGTDIMELMEDQL